MAVRKALRIDKVFDASGYKKTQLYQKIDELKFPPPYKPDPEGRAVLWWEDEVEAWQRGEWRPTEEAIEAWKKKQAEKAAA